jgi:thiol-disulfide isomerase/thioredoxin
MSRRLAVGAGLVAGVLVAGLVVGAIVVLVPPPSATIPSPSPSPSPDPDPSPGPSGPPGASPTASPPATPRPTIVATGFHIGEMAPALVVPQVGGGTIDLEALRGKAVWVNFMATWCPPCIDEFPLMNGFAARHAPDGLVVIAVDLREDEGTVASFARSLSVIFPMGLDEAGTTQEAWDVIALPMHFWIDAEGVIRDGAFGGIGPDIMADGLRTILPGVEIET